MARLGPSAARAGAVLALALVAQLRSRPAEAQILPPDDGPNVSRFVGVRDRVTPGYDVSGVPLGTFTLLPSLSVSGAYTDNVFALERPKESDAYVRIAPAAQLQSNWKTASLTLSGDAMLDRYSRHASENVSAVNLSAYAVDDVTQGLRLRLIGRFSEGRESRESENAFTLTERPVAFSAATAAAGASQQLGPLKLSGEVGVQALNFSDARLANGAPLDQDYRDETTTQGRVRADIAQSPSLAYFAQLTLARSNYSQRTALGGRRDGDTQELLAGARFELPALAVGEIGAGYLRSDYRDDRMRRFSGMGLNSKVTIFPTQLTTVTLEAVRSINDAGTPDSTTYVATRGGVRVDYELLRSLIVGVRAGYEQDQFNGADRQDRRFDVGVSADYRLTPAVSLRLSYDRLDLRSSGADRYKSFSRNGAAFGISLRI